MSHKRIFFQLSACPVGCRHTITSHHMSQTSAPLTLAQWVATHLEFAPHNTDLFGQNHCWKASAMRCLMSVVTRVVLSLSSKEHVRTQSIARPLASLKLAYSKCDIARHHWSRRMPNWHRKKVLMRHPHFCTGSLQTLTGNEDDVFPRSAAVRAAMAQVANADEQAITRPFKSKGLELEPLPRSTPDGKMTHTRVVSGGCWKEVNAKLRG